MVYLQEVNFLPGTHCEAETLNPKYDDSAPSGSKFLWGNHSDAETLNPKYDDGVPAGGRLSQGTPL